MIAPPGTPGAGRVPMLGLDLDGTLIDARLRQVGVAVEVFSRVTGGALPAEAFWNCKRSGASTLNAMVELGLGEDIAREVAGAWGVRVESEDWLDRDREIPGTRALLHSLRDGGIDFVVLTARKRRGSAERSLAAAGLEALVERLVVVDPAVSAQAKAAALRDSGCGALIGDSESDGLAASLARLPFIAVATGQRSAAFLREHGYEVAASLADAVEFVLPRREAA